MSESNGSHNPPAVPTVNGEPLTPTAQDGSKALKLIDAALERFSRAYRSATEANYATGAAGINYVNAYLSASPKALRSVAVGNLAEEAVKWDEDSILIPLSKVKARLVDRVSRLLDVSGAVLAFTGSTDAPRLSKGKGAVPWTQVRELLPLVDRIPTGTYIVPDCYKVKADELWADVMAGALSREEIARAAATIVAEEAARIESVKREERDRLKAEQAARDKAAEEAKREEARLAAEVEEAEEAEEAEPEGETKTVLSANVEAAREELRAAQTEAIEKTTAAEQTAAKRATAEQEAKEASDNLAEATARKKKKDEAADKKKDKAADAAAPSPAPAGGATVKPGAPIADPRPEPASGNVFANLTKMTRKGGAKDVGEGIAEAIRGATDPLALLAETLAAFASISDAELTTVLTCLSGAANISAKGKRAVDAALLILSRKERGGVDPAALNGATVGAA